MRPGKMKLSPADRQLLNIIQTGFPYTSSPYAAVAAQMNIPEREVLERIAALKEKGIIRRIGGIFNSQKMGFSSTLVALRVEEGTVEKVAHAVNGYAGVTHNYQREHEFNLWFTLVTASDDELDRTLAEIAALPGVLKLRNLPAVKLFKIGVNFDMSGE